MGTILSVMILIKLALYYHFMDVSSNYFFLILFSSFYILTIFFIVENKKVAGCLYFLISILMFVDVIYFSNFNRNLSVNVLGTAGYIDDVASSVWAIIKGKFFLLMIDALVILVLLVLSRKNSKAIPKIQFSMLNHDRNKKLKTKATVFLMVFLLTVVMVTTPSQGDMLTPIVNQEFFSYHIKDIVTNIQDEMEYSDNLTNIQGEYIPEEKGPVFGVGVNKNLIVIQVESLQNFVINEAYEGQEITPNLNQLIQEGFYFDEYYQQTGSGNTSDAEFVSQNSLHASYKSFTYELYTDNYFYGLPWLLRDKGYKTLAFHGYSKDFWNREGAYPTMGFEQFIGGEDYDVSEPIGLGLGDSDFFKQSVKHLQNIEQPFYSFFVTLSNHHPYEMPEAYQTLKLKEEDQDTLFGRYLQAVHYTDQSIGAFIRLLKDSGLYENTVIAIYGDHFGINCKEETAYAPMSDFLGFEYDYDEMFNIPLIIHVPKMQTAETIHTTGGQLDFMPTMAYIMGIDYLDTLYFGNNLFKADTGFVTSQVYMPKGSYIKDHIAFEMSKDGVFENSRAWDIKTREAIDIKRCREDYERAVNQVDLGHFYLENDVLRKVLLENVSIDELLKKELEEDD